MPLSVMEAACSIAAEKLLLVATFQRSSIT